jgi:hypothetical protein
MFSVILVSVWLEVVFGVTFRRLVGLVLVLLWGCWLGLVCGSDLGRLVASWLMKGEPCAIREPSWYSMECHIVVCR